MITKQFLSKTTNRLMKSFALVAGFSLIFLSSCAKEVESKSAQPNGTTSAKPEMERNRVSEESVKLPTSIPIDLYVPPEVTVTDTTFEDGDFSMMGKIKIGMDDAAELIKKNMLVAEWQQKIDMKQDDSMMLEFVNASTTVVYTLNKQKDTNLISIMYH